MSDVRAGRENRRSAVHRTTYMLRPAVAVPADCQRSSGSSDTDPKAASELLVVTQQDAATYEYIRAATPELA